MLQRTIDTAAFLKTDPVRTLRTGLTPHTVVFTQGKSALRYFPVPEGVEQTRRPAFVSMPLINTWSIWDLLPGRSVIETLTNAGMPVYVIDWGRPGAEDATRPLSYYLDEVLVRMHKRAERHAAAQQILEPGQKMDAIGYCVGGTFLAVAISRNPDRFRKAAFVATPIDFHQSGRLATWANPETFPLDALVAGPRNFPKEMMQDSFAWLRVSGSTRKWMSLWERIDQPGFPELWAALEQWNNDGVDFPGSAYREYVQSCYFDNALMNGGWTMGTRAVDLADAKIPALVLEAASDHIAPPAACQGMAKAWGGPVTVLTLKGGHVGVSVTAALPAALLDWTAE